MFNRLWVRITFSFLLLMSVLLLVSGFLLAKIIKDTYYEIKENQLIETAILVTNVVQFDDLNKDNLQNKIIHISDNITPRLTIIDRTGTVLADTEEDPLKMENHFDRPEIEQIFNGQKDFGLSVRYSDTLDYDMMYVTTPILDQTEVIGVVRTSLSMEKIQSVIHSLWFGLACVMFIAWLFTGLIGMRIARNISSPVEEMIRVSERLKEKDYQATVKQKPKGELGELANAINILAAGLENQMKKIEENEQRMTGVLTNMMNGVLLINTEGEISLANRAAGKLIGQDPQQISGKNHLEAIRNVELNSLIERSLQEVKEYREEIHILYPQEKIVDVHLAPYVGDSGIVKGVIAVLHDVTNIRRLEKMRSQFVANVSHELKTPITSVKGFAETLLDGAMEDEEVSKKFLKIIHDESDRIHRLIEDLLYLSSIEHHQMPLRIENVNLTASVEEIVETLKEKLKKKKLTLVFRKPKDVWLEGERDRIQQVIVNLLSNAISYTPEGGQITVDLEDKRHEVSLIITDTGIGISQKELPRIFERFYRVDKARSRSSGGTGLGLAIVKHLVESHHGHIDVDSKIGEGTTFTVNFPKKQKNQSK